MRYKTAEEIAKENEHLSGVKSREAINRAFLLQDDSRLWPINGRFNATKRAIRNVMRIYNQTNDYELDGIDYSMAIEYHLSVVVNNAI